MSDLISKKALLEVIYQNVNPDNNGNWLKSKPLLDFIESAPAVSGEAVACYVSKTAFEVLDTSYSGINHKGISKEQLLPDDIALYLAPPQPQSVKDAKPDVYDVVLLRDDGVLVSLDVANLTITKSGCKQITCVVKG